MKIKSPGPAVKRLLAALFLHPNNPLRVLALCALAGACVLPAEAAVIAGHVQRLSSTTFQDITLLGGTPLNPGGALTVPVTGKGFLEFTFDDENEGAAEISFAVTDSQFSGANPLGDYILTANSLAGTITNVTKSDASGTLSSFLSGSLDVSGFFIREITNGPGAGIVLFTQEPAEFSGPVTALPFPEGTTFVSPDPLDVFVNLGGDDVLVAISFNRSVTIAPEPSTLTLASLALFGCALVRRRRLA